MRGVRVCLYVHFQMEKVHQLIELDYEQIEPERSESKQAKENITMIFY